MIRVTSHRISLILVGLVTLSLFLLIPPAHAFQIMVSQAHLPDYYSRPITQNQTAEVLVGVNSTYPVKNNVTLFYADVSSDIVPNGYQYKPIGMSFAWGTDTNGTYETIMPRMPNETWVWAFAVAVDVKGNSGGGQDNSRRVYRSWTPNPKASILDVDIFLGHIDPKQLTLNMSISGILTNYATWSPEILRLNYLPTFLTINHDEGNFVFSSGNQQVLAYYISGHPELYPFDGYTFTFSVVLPKYLNSSGAQVEGMPLEAFRVYPDIIWFAPLTLPERLDNSAWEIHSYVEFNPSHNYTLVYPYVQVTITLERKPDQVNYLLLYPVVALYALLGFSVLLRGKDEIRNRLLVYLNVFVFSYGFQSSIRNLSITPLLTGFSMIERTALALIPCTVILAVLSILGTVLTHWRNAEIDVSRISVMLGTDVVGIFLAAGLVWNLGTVTVSDYFGRVQTFHLLDMSWFGLAIIVSLFAGLIINAALLIPMKQYSLQQKRTLFLLLMAIALIFLSYVSWSFLANPGANGTELGIFLATALSTIAFVSFSVWDRYVESPALEILHDPSDNVNYFPQLTIISYSPGGTNVNSRMIRFLRVMIQNSGSRTAKRCLARLELIRHMTPGNHTLSREAKTLCWVEVPDLPNIPPKARFPLNVSYSQQGLSYPFEGACSGFVRAMIFTKEAFNTPQIRAQDALCDGEYLVKIMVYSDNAQPVEKRFVISVHADWDRLTMGGAPLGA